ncbi:MAG TPA: TRAP transporter large permease subunit [Atribacterota bacterium]|nr:TRAP transporter large permease subunit [Atribacterota bacterium]
MIFYLVISLFVLLFLGIPIYMSLAVSAITTLYIFTPIDASIMAQRFFAGLDSFGLMAMPLFIFGAQIMRDGGIARSLLNWVKMLVCWLPGGTALTAHFSCMFFGALCGSSPATVAAIGGIMYPQLVEENYDKGFSVGLISTSAAVAILIPPSVTMILYGVATGVSIGALFMAGIGAGLVFTFVIALYIWFWVVKNKIPRGQRSSLKDIFKATRGTIWALGIPVIIMGGIYGGVFTPTEAAGVSTVYAIVISLLIYKELNFRGLFKTSIRAGRLCAQVMILTSAAVAFGWLLTVAQIPQKAAAVMLNSGANKYVFLIFVNIIFLIAGMFMDGSGAVMILAPLVASVGVVMGVNPVHLGVIVVTNLAIGMITPPVGLNLYIASGITGVPFFKIIPHVVPFFFVTLIALLLITYVPDISMFLTRMVYPVIR